MDSFDIEAFRKSLVEFWQVKDKHGPYDYRDWRVNPSDNKCAASKCIRIMSGIEKQIRLLFKEIIKGMQFQRCKGKVFFMEGAAYFPINPKIVILFENESLDDGIYPVVSINEQGLVIGCVESYARPQPDFMPIALSDDEIASLDDKFLRSVSTIHLSRNYKWFPRNSIFDILKQTLMEALEAAIRDYLKCRGKNADARVTKRQKGEQEGKWFTRIPVSSVEEWLKDVSELKDHWLFRGQGNAEWGLSTGIWRVMDALYDKDKRDAYRIRDYENEAVQNFRREIARKPEYASFCDIDLMATMQHYGSKTRLLDFSFSPLVALYMAISQFEGEKETPSDISVWAVKGDELPTPMEDLCVARTSDKRLDTICEKADKCEYLEWWEKCMLWHFDANNLLLQDSRIFVEMGVDIVFPNANNERISAQEGLFLMPRNVGESFETNLKKAFSGRATIPNPHVVEYVFDKGQINSVKSCLHRFRITAKLIYPDLEGLAKSMSEKLDFGLK